MTVVPAYGRDYKSAKAVKADWEAGKDFEAVSIGASGYVNKEGAKGVGSVTIRYAKLTKCIVVQA